MIKILGKRVVLWLCFATGMVQAGSVEAMVDEHEVAKGESVLFSITVVGEESDPLPELSDINGYKIEQITRNRGSDFVHIDGKSVMQTTTTITYEFKPQFNMTIPAFQVMVDGKVETTEAISLRVVEKRVGSKPKNKYFSLEMRLNKENAYVGEPLVATVIFRQNSKINLMELDYKKPPFTNFFAKQLDEEKSYQEGVYKVHELNYLLMPKKEGSVTIEPATAKVAQRVEEKQAGGWFANVPKWSNIASERLNLEVKKPMGVYDIGGDFTLKSSVDTKEAKANKPINLTIEFKGEGSLEAFSGFEFDIPDVTVYSDDAKVKSDFSNNKLSSHYIKTFVFIADHDFTIPSKTVNVFNYKTGKIKKLTTSTYEIKVGGGVKKEVVSPSTQPLVYSKNRQVAEEPKGSLTDELLLKTEAINERFVNLSPGFKLLGLMFLLGFFSAFLIKYLFRFVFGIFRKKEKRESFDGHEALQILYPHIGEHADVEYMVRQLYAIKRGEKRVKLDKKLLKELLNQYKPSSK
jgi:hypothetical protein